MARQVGTVKVKEDGVVARARLWAAMHADECEYWAPDDPELADKAREEPEEYEVAPKRPYFHITKTLTSMNEPNRDHNSEKWHVVYEWMYGKPWRTQS